MKLLVIILTLSVLILSGCSSNPKNQDHHPRTVHQDLNIQKHQSAQRTQAVQQPQATKKIHFNNSRQVKQSLMSQLRLWEGTPYQFGGTTKKGIDCSAFVQTTFKSKLGINLSRTTRSQVKEGVYVSKNNLRPGDIVFFKTGNNSRHNGIYIGNNQFIHASTSRGVTTSDITSPYWRKRYWTSRRLEI